MRVSVQPACNLTIPPQPWLCQIELYGGKNSAINAVDPDATAFAHRRSRFTIQLYGSSPNGFPPYPQEGFTLVDGG